MEIVEGNKKKNVPLGCAESVGTSTRSTSNRSKGSATPILQYSSCTAVKYLQTCTNLNLRYIQSPEKAKSNEIHYYI